MDRYDDIHGPFGVKEGLAASLINQGINFNDLKPGTKRRRGRDRPASEIALGHAEQFMMRYGLSVDDLKEGTFYSSYENGLDVNGKEIGKEEGLRRINQINADRKFRYYNKPPKMTEEEIARTLKTWQEFEQKLSYALSQEDNKMQTNNDPQPLPSGDRKRKYDDVEEEIAVCNYEESPESSIGSNLASERDANQ